MILRLLVVGALVGLPVLGAAGQEHRHPPSGRAPEPRDSATRRDARAAGDTTRPMMDMMTGPLGISMSREGSGTSWLPDSTPMYAHHRTSGQWTLMLHGNVFAQYISEGSDRGDDQFGVVNWVMGMARRRVGASHFGVRTMLSAEAVTVGECGYPDLLATGESCNGGEFLHDRQHPHDLFMELAGIYERELTPSLALQLYGGPVGEPALGPVAYPHRISAMPGPLATIGHHWQDATHISFGVATAGLYGRRWKVEGSLFNGREPDENRFDFDLARLDSYSGRVWFVPTGHWAMQVSLGRLTDAEPPREPGEGRATVTRATTSVTNHRSLGARGNLATTAVWGQNRAHGLRTDAFLVESAVNLDERDVFFGRGEIARKSGEDLVIDEDAPALAEELFTVSKVSVGYVRQFGSRGALVPGIGAQISVNFVPSELEPFYGGGAPVGLAIFASVKPRVMRMEHMEHPMVAGAPGHAGHAPATPDSGAARDTAGHVGHEGMPAMSDSGQLRLMHEIHRRMMADSVIRQRVASDTALQALMQRLPPEMRGDTGGVHRMHGADSAADSAESRQVMEFVMLLLSDPAVERRLHADPRFHLLWSDPAVQRCLATMRRLKAAGQPIPAACPAAAPAGSPHNDRHPPD
jgi:hypothetical protein